MRKLLFFANIQPAGCVPRRADKKLAIQTATGPLDVGLPVGEHPARGHYDLIETRSRETLPLPVTGAILCGGKSLRMGRTKAFLPYGGSTFIETRYADMQELFGEVLLVANDTEAYSHLDVDVVKDIIPNRGPLVGILSALLVSRYAHVFVIACDMPLVTRNLMRDMAAARHDTDVLVLEHGGAIEPLLGIYSRRCIQPLEDSIFTGNGRVMDVLAGMMVSTYTIPPDKSMSGQLPVHFNVNTPADYSKIITQG
jgi:molybdenum cofactor guanylyltransferase